jgi:hypothetical protein
MTSLIREATERWQNYFGSGGTDSAWWDTEAHRLVGALQEENERQAAVIAAVRKLRGNGLTDLNVWAEVVEALDKLGGGDDE